MRIMSVCVCGGGGGVGAGGVSWLPHIALSITIVESHTIQRVHDLRE